MTSQTVQKILREGSRFDLPQLRLYYRTAQASSPQSACVVGKKVHPHATIRHRYQRLLREAVREFLKAHPAYDMVVVAKPAITQIQKLPELQHALTPLFEKLAANYESRS